MTGWRHAGRRLGVLAATSAALAVAACGSSHATSTRAGGGASKPASSPALPAGDLRTALSFLPSGTEASYTFDFADWQKIEGAFGYRPAVFAGGPYGAFLRKLGSTYPPPAAGEADWEITPANTTQLWSGNDVAWDASFGAVLSGPPPVQLTGFVPAFPIMRIASHLAGCGFTRSRSGSFTVMSGSQAEMLNCIGPLGADVPPVVTVYALDPQDHLAVMSASRLALADALDNRTLNQLSPTASALLQGLHRYEAVHLSVGPQWCEMLSKPFMLAGRLATPALVARAPSVYPDDTPYLGWGFGYTYPPSRTSAAIAFAYSTPSAARSDLGPREHILKTGISLASNKPYSALLRVTSGSAVGSTAVIGLDRPPGRRLPLADMAENIELGFARC